MKFVSLFLHIFALKIFQQHYQNIMPWCGADSCGRKIKMFIYYSRTTRKRKQIRKVEFYVWTRMTLILF